MIRHEDVYQIGHIAKAHALQGEVVFNFTDDIFDTTDADYLIVETDGILVPFFIETLRMRGSSSALVKFCDIDNVDQTRRLVGCDVFFEKSKATEAGEEEMSLNYFVGFQMLDGDGKPIGRIDDVDDQTDNWLFVVTKPDGSETLVPAHEAFIADIDHEDRTMTMDLPEGLLDL